MCGYIEINGERPDPIMQNPELAIADAFLSGTYKKYYPAFGQNPNRKIDVVIEEDGEYKSVEATWGYDCFDTSEGLMVGDLTTFNAKDLSKDYWQKPLKQRRGVVFATGIGEKKMVGKTKHQYYMQSDEVFALGALYKKHPNGEYSCAVITRDEHPKMKPFHDNAFPCFLPIDERFLKIWLSKGVQTAPEIDYLLQNPTLYPTLHVQPVKTYKDKVPMKSHDPVTLVSDIKKKESVRVGNG